MRKIYITALYGLLILSYPCRAINVVIIESQSYNAGHDMDVEWRTVCTGLGYSATIYPQTQLDNTSWFATTDFLVVASGVITLTPARLATIQSFAQQGGRVYLQSEYDCSYTTNTGFEQIVYALGGSFNWQGISAGYLQPMNVLGSLSNTPNAVAPFPEFWYGCSGIGNGCNSHIEPFLQYNGLYFGFIFCVPGSATGRIITTADQDWIRVTACVPLVQNIAINLANPPYSCAVQSGGLSVNLGPDTTLCNGQSVLLNGTTAGATSYLWSTGAVTSSISTNTSGTYWLRASNSGCNSTDTIRVNFVSPPALNLGNDSTLCTGQTMVLNGTAPGATSYLWSTGANSAVLNVTTAGAYWLRALSGSCSSSDTVQVSFLNMGTPTLGNDTILCNGQSVILNGTTSGATAYLWNTGAVTSSVQIVSTGTYWLRASNSACTSSDTIQVSMLNLGTPNLGNDTSLCAGQNAVLNGTATGATAYLWSTGAVSPSLTVGGAGNYWVRASIGSCSSSDTVLISAVNLSPINLGNDTSFCSPNQVILNAATSGGAVYRWQDNSSQATYTVTQSGNYSVTASVLQCSVDDSIQVNIISLPPITASANKITFCSYDSAQVCSPAGFAIYQWNNGGNTGCFYTQAAGSYFLTVTDNNGCTALSDTVSLTVNPVPNAAITTSTPVICASDTAVVCAPSGFTIYHWNNGRSTNCITANLAGNYYVTVTDNNGCTVESNHLAITVHQLPPVSISINGDTLGVYNAVSQQWFLNGNEIPGATDSVYLVQSGGSYSVQVTDSNGCVASSMPILITGTEIVSRDDVVSVYPNPSEVGSWKLEVGNNLIGSTAEVFDANGRVVFQQLITEHQSLITFEAAQSVYLLRISSSKSSAVRKLVKL